jgi:prepilin-type N-terminal cleavage/methylation domain-containing protein
MSTYGSASNTPEAGYTLLEMLTVLALTLLLAASVLPSLRHSDADQLNKQAEQIATQLRSARLQALKFGEPVSWRPSAELLQTLDGGATKIVFYPDYTATAAELILRKGEAVAIVTVAQAGGWVKVRQ